MVAAAERAQRERGANTAYDGFGVMPIKMGRRVGRQAQTTAMQVSGTVQYIRVVVGDLVVAC